MERLFTRPVGAPDPPQAPTPQVFFDTAIGAAADTHEPLAIIELREDLLAARAALASSEEALYFARKSDQYVETRPPTAEAQDLIRELSVMKGEELASMCLEPNDWRRLREGTMTADEVKGHLLYGAAMRSREAQIASLDAQLRLANAKLRFGAAAPAKKASRSPKAAVSPARPQAARAGKPSRAR